jgi:hypothetical protein
MDEPEIDLTIPSAPLCSTDAEPEPEIDLETGEDTATEIISPTPATVTEVGVTIHEEEEQNPTLVSCCCWLLLILAVYCL